MSVVVCLEVFRVCLIINTTWTFEEATAINARYVADEGLVVGTHGVGITHSLRVLALA